MSRASGVGAVLAAALLWLPAATAQPVAAQTMTVAYPFGVGEAVPEPRARFNGAFTSRAGVTETLMGLDHDMQLFPWLAERISRNQGGADQSSTARSDRPVAGAVGGYPYP